MFNNGYFSRGSVVKGDIRLLTAIQTRVHLLDVDGLTPTQISERTGLSLSRVSNIKTRLRQLGFTVLKFRRTKHELREHRAREAAKGAQYDADIARSKHEPDDDEQPDTDEPAFTDIARCQCGLILPCYHGNDEINLAGSSAGTAVDVAPFRDENDERSFRYPSALTRTDRRRKTAQLARADTARLSATQERPGLDGTVHVP